MMQSHRPKTYLPGLFTMGLAACMAASMTYLLLYWPVSEMEPVQISRNPDAAEAAPLDTASLARLLGARNESAPRLQPVDGRFRLVGVVASGAGAGAALIAVDGKPARAYPLGSKVADNLHIQSIASRRAVLAEEPSGSVVLVMELPPAPK